MPFISCYYQIVRLIQSCNIKFLFISCETPCFMVVLHFIIMRLQSASCLDYSSFLVIVWPMQCGGGGTLRPCGCCQGLGEGFEYVNQCKNLKLKNWKIPPSVLKLKIITDILFLVIWTVLFFHNKTKTLHQWEQVAHPKSKLGQEQLFLRISQWNTRYITHCKQLRTEEWHYIFL